MYRHLRYPVVALSVACVVATVAAQSVPSGPSAPAASAAQAQSPPGTPAADLLREGFELYELNQVPAARERFDRALALARDAKNPVDEAEAHRGIGLVFFERADYSAARAELDQALMLFERANDPVGVARVEQHLGVVAQLTGDFMRSRDLLSRALAEFETLGRPGDQARVLMMMSADTGPGAADAHGRLIRAQEIADGLHDPRLQGNVLRLMGDSEFGSGDFATAMATLETAITLLEKAGAKRDLARALTSLGRLDRAHGYPERAQTLYRRALAIQEEIGDEQGAIQSINAIAVAFTFLGKLREAVAEYERALALARQTGSTRIINFQLGNLAKGYDDTGAHARAAELFREVLRQPIEPLVAAYRYAQLSDAYVSLGRNQDALEAADKAIELTRTVGPVDALVTRLHSRAWARLKLGQTTQALADEREALQTIEDLRARLVPTDFMKRGFGKQSQEIFAFAVELLQKLGQDADALETAEQARARAFLDLLTTRASAGGAASAPATNAIEAATMSSATTSGARADMLRLRGGGEVSTAATSDLKSPAAAPAVNLGEIRAVARELQSTLLIYYVTAQATFIWVVQPSSTIRLTRVDVSAAHLTDLIRRTRPESRASSRGGDPQAVDREMLATRGGDTFFFGHTQRAAWQALYQLLIRRVRDQLPTAPGSRIAIVPHGPLFLLSFAALQDEDGRYLLEKYTLNYAPTAALLQLTHDKRFLSGSPRRFLLIADPASMPAGSDGQRLVPLPGTRREVTAIAPLLAGSSVTVLTGHQANISDVRHRMRDATVIHFATHGIVRDDAPFGSFLALGRSAPGTKDDGRLTAEEIYGLDLRADVVVLSACRTALGEISGDGIAGLTRAFFYAGASSVVATMWDVADEPTVHLMPEFYRLLVRGRDKARSLRGAQLKLLADLRAGRIKITSSNGETTLAEDPFFWAGFVLVGES